MFGLALDEAGLALFHQCTGRSSPSLLGYLEASLIIGRRGGKSLILALIAAYLACFHDWSPYLTGGERGTIMIIATDRRQATTIFKYLRGMLGIPLLAGLIQRETSDTIDLSNSITIEIQTASFRTVRGRTVVAALCDELAFWMGDDSANPDTEILAALKPAMATIPKALMLKASSPYSRRGALWNDHRKHFGKDDSTTLVWQAPTRVMNPSVPEAFIAGEYENDPSAAAAEYGAQFSGKEFRSRQSVGRWVGVAGLRSRAIRAASLRAGRPYSLSWPNNFRVFRLIKCNPVQAGHVIPSYSFSDASSSSSNQCWTFIDVSGQVNMKAAIGLDRASEHLGFDLTQRKMAVAAG
jgi:hypothetical protein